MAFLHSIARWLKTQDGPQITYLLQNQTGNTAISLPSSGSFAPGNVRAGYVRIKGNTIGSNGQCKIGTISATDGINVSNIYKGDTHYSTNGQYIDSSYFFNYDWQCSVINLNVWTFNASSTFDIEVTGVM